MEDDKDLKGSDYMGIPITISLFFMLQHIRALTIVGLVWLATKLLSKIV